MLKTIQSQFDNLTKDLKQQHLEEFEA